LNSDKGAVTPDPSVAIEDTTIKKWIKEQRRGTSNPPMIFFVMVALGTRIIKTQKGCGRKVSTLKAEWMGSGDIGTSAIDTVVTA
jgi:hypothetical protein